LEILRENENTYAFLFLILRQRTKTESDTSSAVRVWRPSSDNPDGEIITEKPTPPPPPSAPSTGRCFFNTNKEMR